MAQERSFSLEMNDIIHSQFHFEQYTSIIEVIQQNTNKTLSALEFKLKIPSISDWDDLKVGQNLNYLKKIGILDFEIISDSPIKFKCTVDEGKLNVFKKWTDNNFLLESNYTKDDFLALIKKMEKDVFEESYDRFLEYWKNTILGKYSKSERKKALIQQRDKEIEYYDSNKNLVQFYDLTDFEQLAEDIHRAVISKYKIPIDPNFPHILFNDGINALERALDLRFRCWYRIKSLNQLIDEENNTATSQSNLEKKDNVLGQLNKKPTAGKTPKTKQKILLKHIVEGMKEGSLKTGAIEYACSKVGYTERTGFNIFKKVENGELIYKELTEILNHK